MIFDKLSTFYAKKLPFVCFRKPNEQKVNGYFDANSNLKYSNSYTEEGFVFAPFDDKDAAILFDKETCEIIEEPYKEEEKSTSENNIEIIASDKNEHIQLIEKGIEEIKKNQFKKVVLSRKEVVKISNLEIVKTFKKLLSHYGNAFVYVWYHPEIGLWMGATPERLVTLKNGQFKTMALASTQTYQGNMNPIWGEKEKKEHQYVVDYIVSQIKDKSNGIVLDTFYVSETYTAKAGNLLHLKADIQGKIDGFNLKNLLNTLHPTPAVCGLPKQKAKQFILENENYQRDFYTGFLGEMNMNSETELFVNLRCVEFLENSANIYVGGGITVDSNPEREWEETIAKAKTIKNVL